MIFQPSIYEEKKLEIGVSNLIMRIIMLKCFPKTIRFDTRQLNWTLVLEVQLISTVIPESGYHP